MRWSLDDLRPLQIVIDEAADPMAIIAIGTPAGRVRMIAEISDDDGTLRLDAAHVEGPGRNAIGIANMRVLAELVMETLNYEAIEIQGAGRTTGANPSRDHRPRFRFTRRRASDL